MKRALGGEGILEVAHAGLTDTTRAGRQSGLEGMCVGIVSGVRNPVSHEPESSLGIGREDALHILGTISYLCGQVEGTRRRPEPVRAETSPETRRPATRGPDGEGAGSRAGAGLSVRALGSIPRDRRSDLANPDNDAYRGSEARRTRQPAKAGSGGGHRRDRPPGLARLPGGGNANIVGERRGFYVPLNTATKGAVCKSGHVMGAVLEDDEFDGPCPECGADVLTACPRCSREIDAGADRVEPVPACPQCGGPFPWSAEAGRARRTAALKILGAVAAGVTIIAGLFYVGTFF